jgi:predicted helicase
MQTFSEIYLLNLHGNARKREVCPDGSIDENVFDIQQGVAIGIFIKQPGDAAEARIYHADLWGLREGKYQALAEMELGTTPWQELQPNSPYYLFVPQAVELRAEYERGWPVNEIFPLNVVGLFTSRDHLAVGWSQEEVWETVRDFAALPEEQAREKYKLGQDVRDWKVKLAQADIKKSGPTQKLVVPILYRPFDVRFTYYTGKSRGFICMPRPEVNSHILSGKNIVLITSKLTKGEEFAHVQVTRNIIEKICMSSKTSNNGFAFPLYFYHTVFGQVNRTPNINPAFINDLSGKVGLAFLSDGRGDLETTMGPEDVFSYAYAVFHSPTYRQRYVEFLRGDFPRLPLTGNQALFAALVGQGAELAALHLLEAPALEKLITYFSVPGSNKVEKMRYDEAARRVYFNDLQYFEGVPPEAWAFQVGGYQVLHKWLKDRKGRTLSFADLHHYQKIVVALAETIRLMGEIDATIDAHGGWPLMV